MKSKFTNLSLAEQDKSNTVKFKTDAANGVTVCRLYDRWYDRYFIGVTRCHDVDAFDEKKGRAIAFNKARRKEVLADLAMLEKERKYVTRRYEEYMNRLDKNEGLKHIYLAGIEEELKELMHDYVPGEEVDEVPVNAQAGKIEDAQVEKQEEKPIDLKDIKLKQFAKINKH